MTLTPTLIPTLAESVSRARTDLRMGLPVVLGAHLAAAVETLPPDRMAQMLALGPAVLAVTERRAGTLKAMVYDGDLARIELPRDADPAWLRAVADPAGDLMTPMKGPFRLARGGDVTAHRAAIALAKSAQLLPAVLLVALAEPPQGLVQLAPGPVLDQLAAARLPLLAAENSKLHIFRPDDGAAEHYAVEIGAPSRARPVLARLHSACFTGDVLGSLKCDCGPQLHAALAAMGQAGEGVLLYLNQEGRGIGLAFEDDERDFRVGAGILREMGFASVRLMTNNPRKVAMLESHGIAVTERVPLVTPRNRHNTGYLDVKAAKSGHLL